MNSPSEIHRFHDKASSGVATAVLVLASVVSLGPLLARQPSTVDMARFGAKPDGSDTTPAVMAALESVRETGANRITFAPGRYDFYPERAFEEYLFVSNNDEGLKRIAFPLAEMRGLEIDGGGATFVFHGYTVPFLISESSKVTLRNFSVDFSRPFHSEGKVLAITPQHVDLEFSKDYPYEIRNGVLVFTNGKKAETKATTVTSGEVLYPYGSLLAFDPIKQETAFMAKDRYQVGAGIAAHPIGPNKIRLKIPNISARVGETLVFSPKNRDVPGIVITDSSGVRLTDVTLHHCGGMGVIAQRSEDLFYTRLQVTPPPGGTRIISTTADATHFVNCKGRIEMVDCLFEQQKDDPTNVHGLYAKITEIYSRNRFETTMIHPQQAGVDFIKAGTRLELNDGPSLTGEGFATVRSVQRLNRHRTIVEVEEGLPESVTVGDSVADADANTAEVLIRNCVMRGNRARGILLGSRGRIVVEGNTFHTPGAAILFEGDSRFWFEQAGVRDVLIRGNTFDNCNYGVWGTGTIQVGSGIAEEFRSTSRYNRNIRIEDNLFRSFGRVPLLSMYSVDGLTFTGNRLEKTTAYPLPGGKESKLFDVTDSDNVNIEDPAVVAESNQPAGATN